MGCGTLSVQRGWQERAGELEPPRINEVHTRKPPTLICLELRGFWKHKTFNGKTGKVPGKPGPLVFLTGSPEERVIYSRQEHRSARKLSGKEVIL